MDNQYWNGIRSLLWVMEYGSFTKAADKVGISKAALSQQVSQLEKELGVQLLHRTTRKMRLTEAGYLYVKRCRNAIQQLEIAQEEVLDAMQALSGVIRINTVGGLIGEELLAPVLLAFQRKYPKIEIRLDFSSHHVNLLEEHYDLVIRMGELPDSSLLGRHLLNLRTCYVASPELLQQYPKLQHPNDLKQMPLVYGSVKEWSLQKEDEQIQIKVTDGFAITNGRVMAKAAEQGLGVARVADVYVAEAIAQQRLVEVLPEWSEITPLTMLCPPARYPLHRIRVLMDWLIEHTSKQYKQLLSIK